jgi:hypothetical protein
MHNGYQLNAQWQIVEVQLQEVRMILPHHTFQPAELECKISFYCLNLALKHSGM